MFRTLSNSWELVKASAAVLRSDKELVVFPIVSGLASLLVLATFAVPMIFAGLLDQVYIKGHGVQPLGALVAFLFYLVQYTVIFFANTALVGAAMIRLQGGDPTLRDGFRIASARVAPILGYALISATVGMVLRAVAERSGIIGRIVISLTGFVWNIATYLVVPVLVVEDVGPVDAIKRSTDLIKRTWGEKLAGNAGMSSVFGLITFCALLLGIALLMAVLLVLKSVAGAAVVAALLVMGVLGIGVVHSTLQGIYTAAVYRYAAEGQIGGEFSAEMIQGAFRRR